MKSINISIVKKYLDLLDLLIRNPVAEERIKIHEDLELLFINFHHLVNEYRPHQARETLIALLKDQITSRKVTTTNLTKLLAAIKKLLTASLQDLKSIPIQTIPDNAKNENFDAMTVKSELSDVIDSCDKMHDEL